MLIVVTYLLPCTRTWTTVRIFSICNSFHIFWILAIEKKWIYIVKFRLCNEMIGSVAQVRPRVWLRHRHLSSPSIFPTIFEKLMVSLIQIQSVERPLCMRKVWGSIPHSSIFLFIVDWNTHYILSFLLCICSDSSHIEIYLVSICEESVANNLP